MRGGNRYRKNHVYCEHDVMLYLDGSVKTGILLQADPWNSKVLVGRTIVRVSTSKLSPIHS